MEPCTTHQGTKENDHIGHCTHTLKSTNVKVQNYYGGTQMVEALLYKPEGRGFDSRWSHWKLFIEIIHSAAQRPWGRLSLE